MYAFIQLMGFRTCDPLISLLGILNILNSKEIKLQKQEIHPDIPSAPHQPPLLSFSKKPKINLLSERYPPVPGGRKKSLSPEMRNSGLRSVYEQTFLLLYHLLLLVQTALSFHFFRKVFFV